MEGQGRGKESGRGRWERNIFISVGKFEMILPLEDSFLCGEITGNKNVKVETGPSLIQCNDGVEEILVLWG